MICGCSIARFWRKLENGVNMALNEKSVGDGGIRIVIDESNGTNDVEFRISAIRGGGILFDIDVSRANSVF